MNHRSSLEEICNGAYMRGSAKGGGSTENLILDCFVREASSKTRVMKITKNRKFAKNDDVVLHWS